MRRVDNRGRVEDMHLGEDMHPGEDMHREEDKHHSLELEVGNLERRMEEDSRSCCRLLV